MAALFGNDQRALKLARVPFVDPEVSGQFHRAAYTLGNVYKRAVTEYRRVQSRKKVVRRRHHGTEVFFNELRMILNCFTEGRENDPQFSQFFLVGGFNRYTIDHRIHRYSGQDLLLIQRNTQLLKGADQFRVRLIKAVQHRLLLGCRVIDNVLIIDGRVIHVRPVWFRHLLPLPERLQAPFQQKLRLFLLGGDLTDHIFIQAFG